LQENLLSIFLRTSGLRNNPKNLSDHMILKKYFPAAGALV